MNMMITINLSVRDELRRSLQLLNPENAVTELRIPKAGKEQTYSGYYDDESKLIDDVEALDGKGPGTYITLNPVNRDLLARSANRCRPYARETTRDADILGRRWMLIDCDPRRPSGVSSTDAEHQAALATAYRIRDALRRCDWPDPVVADSGNGAHLLYRIDLPNDEIARELVKNCLGALAQHFSDDAVEVDQTTFNAARICKLYGTVARKGDNLPDRPHRPSRILEVPGQESDVISGSINIVSRGMLDDLAGRFVSPILREPADDQEQTGQRFDIEEWIGVHGVRVLKGPLPFNIGGRKWIVPCPFNSEHSPAAILRLPNGGLAYKCFHRSCARNDWADFRQCFEPGCYERQRRFFRKDNGELEDSSLLNSTDWGNAQRLVKHHGHMIRYVPAWRAWLIFDMKRWAVDTEGKIEQLAKETIRAMWQERESMPNDARDKFGQHILRSEHEQRIKAMISVAKTEPGVPISPEQLDQHGHLLNVLNGTLDLRTGELKPHASMDLITKLAPVVYDPTARARTFMRFLIKAMGGNRKLVRYVQRAIGYSLTGDCREQVVFFCFGSGANGKSTLLNVITHILGSEYAAVTPSETLIASKNNGGVPNDIARLKGIRHVVAAELEGELNAGKLKKLTGEDKLVGRFMRAEFFEFWPQFKLWIACNDKPRIAGGDHAMWRRIRLIPFNVAIPSFQQDKLLPEKLRAEAEGIFAWAVAGCLEWQRNGLGTPEAVTKATEAYRVEMEGISRFLADCCDRIVGIRVSAVDLWNSYVRWCRDCGETALSKTMFGRKMAQQPGIQRARSGPNGEVQYDGVRVRSGFIDSPVDLNSISTGELTSAVDGDIHGIAESGVIRIDRKPPVSDLIRVPTPTQKVWTI